MASTQAGLTLGFSKLLNPSSSSDQSAGPFQISAAMFPLDAVAPPPVKSNRVKTLPRRLLKKRRRTRRRSWTGDEDDDGENEEIFGFSGDGGFNIGNWGGGGSGGSWNFGGFGGFLRTIITIHTMIRRLISFTREMDAAADNRGCRGGEESPNDNRENNRKRTSRGRQKVPLQKIENKTARQVTFSKRRGGLFKKAAELAVLTGAEVAVIVESSRNIYAFGHPSTDDVIERYFAEEAGSQLTRLPPAGGGGALSSSSMSDPREEYYKLCQSLEAEMKKRDELENRNANNMRDDWWDAPIEDMSLEELENHKTALEELRNNVLNRGEELAALRNNQQMSVYPNPPPPSLPINHNDYPNFGFDPPSLPVTSNNMNDDYGNFGFGLNQNMMIPFAGFGVGGGYDESVLNQAANSYYTTSATAPAMPYTSDGPYDYGYNNVFTKYYR